MFVGTIVVGVIVVRSIIVVTTVAQATMFAKMVVARAHEQSYLLECRYIFLLGFCQNLLLHYITQENDDEATRCCFLC
jgi:hypothetical protein